MSEHMNTLTLSDEFLQRVVVGLGEIQTKFGLPVLQEIERQVQAQRAPQPAEPLEEKPADVQAAV
jgi:hypothetical protein